MKRRLFFTASRMSGHMFRTWTALPGLAAGAAAGVGLGGRGRGLRGLAGAGGGGPGSGAAGGGGGGGRGGRASGTGTSGARPGAGPLGAAALTGTLATALTASGRGRTGPGTRGGGLRDGLRSGCGRGLDRRLLLYGGGGGRGGCLGRDRGGGTARGGPGGLGPVSGGHGGHRRMGLGPRHVPHRGPGPRARLEVGAALQPVEPGLDRALVVVRRGQQHARADQLQLEPGRGGAPHLRQPGVDEVGGPAELGGAEHGGLGLHALDDVDGRVDEPLLARVRDGGEDDEVPQPLQQIGDEPAGVVAALDHPVDDLEGGGAVTGGERVHHGVEQRPVRVAEEGGGHGVRHTVGGGAGEELVHDGHRVTYGPGPGAHDERQHAVLDGDALAPADLAQVLPQGAGRNEPEGVVVGPRPDRPDDLLGLGGGEDELQMLRRLLDDLQQGVEPRRGDHVGLVDDVDLVPAAGGPEEGLLAQLTGVVHATVRRGVDLDDVDGPRPVARQVPARLALPARGRRRPLLTVQAPREDPRAGGLATSARPAEQVRVIDPVVPQRLLQRVSDMLLPDDLGEGLRAVAAVQRKGRHTYEVIGAD